MHHAPTRQHAQDAGANGAPRGAARRCDDHAVQRVGVGMPCLQRLDQEIERARGVGAGRHRAAQHHAELERPRRRIVGLVGKQEVVPPDRVDWRNGHACLRASCPTTLARVVQLRRYPRQCPNDGSPKQRLDHYSVRDPETGCVACRGTNGYGHVRWDGRLWLAHRAAWVARHHPIPRFGRSNRLDVYVNGKYLSFTGEG